PRGARCSEEVFRSLHRWLFRVVERFQPDFVDSLVAPVSKEADAVSRCENVVEMLLERAERKIFIHGLRDLIGWLNIACDFGDDAERAETDDCAGKCIGIFFSRERDKFSNGVYKFQCGNGGGKTAVVHTGTMGSGGYCSSHGDMRKRGEIV